MDSIFLLLPIKVAGAHPHIVAGENPWHPALSDSPVVSHIIGLFTSREKGKDGSEKGRELKERNLPFSSSPPPSPI